MTEEILKEVSSVFENTSEDKGSILQMINTAAAQNTLHAILARINFGLFMFMSDTAEKI